MLRVFAALSAVNIGLAAASFGVNKTTYNILDFGAQPHDDSTFEVEFMNAQAIMLAISAATDHAEGIHEVLIPEGYWFSFMPIEYEGMTNMTIRIDGDLKASMRHSRYPVNYSYKSSSNTFKPRVAYLFKLDWT